MKDKKHLLILLVPIIVILVSAIFILRSVFTPDEVVFTGMFETKVVNVASEIPGRIDAIYVEKGQSVEKGDTLYTLQRQILDTKVSQAEGLLNAAKSQKEKMNTGTREEVLRAANSQYKLAKSQYSYSAKTYQRFKVLFADSIISKQEMDALEFQFEAAKDALDAAKAHYDMVRKGARKEDLAGADAVVLQAQSVYDEAKVFYEELIVRSPISGEVSSLIGEEGEVMAPGYPVVSVMVPEDVHAVLNVREDKLPLFIMGQKMQGTVSGVGGKEFEFVVSYIAPMADFATWVPTNTKGEFDLKSFEVYLKPTHLIENLRPGMTIQIRP